MQFDEFVGKVQHRARLASGGESVMAIRATLKTLGERLQGGASEHLAAQLPREFRDYLHKAEDEEVTFSVDEFFDRVAQLEEVDKPQAVHHARAVLSVVQEAVSPGEIKHVKSQLPDEWDPLFDAGSEGQMDK